ncbi:hypothetical protein AVEN_121183-1, partial [Araneus ventricosus]
MFRPRRKISLKGALNTLGGIRTRNPRFRRPMPYPLGHEGFEWLRNFNP